LKKLNFLLHIFVQKMDFEKRRKKSDKAKEKFDKNGGFSQKHVRLAEALKLKENPTKKK
jgi:hypothetical protein